MVKEAYLYDLPLPNSECLCIHLKSDVEKFYQLCLMTRKLFVFAKEGCMEENPDSLMCQEVITPGQLYLMFLKVCATMHGNSELKGPSEGIALTFYSVLFIINSGEIDCLAIFSENCLGQERPQGAS